MADNWLIRANAQARSEGWSSYRQKRYWLILFEADQAGTTRQLARRICPEGPEKERPKSLMCLRCDLMVNGDGRKLSREGRRGDWRARLVQVAVHGARSDREAFIQGSRAEVG